MSDRTGSSPWCVRARHVCCVALSSARLHLQTGELQRAELSACACSAGCLCGLYSQVWRVLAARNTVLMARLLCSDLEFPVTMDRNPRWTHSVPRRAFFFPAKTPPHHSFLNDLGNPNLFILQVWRITDLSVVGRVIVKAFTQTAIPHVGTLVTHYLKCMDQIYLDNLISFIWTQDIYWFRRWGTGVSRGPGHFMDESVGLHR